MSPRLYVAVGARPRRRDLEIAARVGQTHLLVPAGSAAARLVRHDRRFAVVLDSGAWPPHNPDRLSLHAYWREVQTWREPAGGWRCDWFAAYDTIGNACQSQHDYRALLTMNSSSQRPSLVLSFGMGLDTAIILAAWCRQPDDLDFDLHDDLLIVSAQTGGESQDTKRQMEQHILPLMRQHELRFVQIARAGSSIRDGYVILDDSRQPTTLHIAGRYTLYDEMVGSGTVPQFASGKRLEERVTVRTTSSHQPSSDRFGEGWCRFCPIKGAQRLRPCLQRLRNGRNGCAPACNGCAFSPICDTYEP